jgi:hypothetical protein
MHRLLLLLAAALLAPIPAAGAPTDLEKALKKIERYAGGNPFEGRYGAFCVCNDAGTSNEKIGVLIDGTATSTQSPFRTILVKCFILQFDKTNDALVSLLPCTSWSALAM